jgi:hypothetical protein
VRAARLAADGITKFSDMLFLGRYLPVPSLSPFYLPCLRGHRRRSSQADDKRLRWLGRGQPVDESVLGGALKGRNVLSASRVEK